MPLVDLSLAYEAGMRGYSFEPAKRLEVDGWNARTLHLYSHSGTHMDAPLHFIAGASTLETLDLDACVGSAVCIDLTPTAPKRRIEAEDLRMHEELIGEGRRVLLRTDWSRTHGTPEYRDEMPGLSPEAAEWLVSRKVRYLGVEPPSVARVYEFPELKAVHEILLGADVVIAESLTHLDRLPESGFEVFSLPLKIAGGDGAPARVCARWPD